MATPSTSTDHKGQRPALPLAADQRPPHDRRPQDQPDRRAASLVPRCCRSVAAATRFAPDGVPRTLTRIEDLAVEQLVAQPGVEALDVAVLPGAAGLDVGRLGA